MDIGLENEWAYCPEFQQPCRILENETVWGHEFFRVWFPLKDEVLRIPAEQFESLDSARYNFHFLAYVTAAARISESLNQDVLLAPIESSVIPLPHQINVLSRAVSGDQVRYLLADEVGLGKTIEAGLIMRELKLRGLVKRVLVAAPKGLVTQWISEMHTHFHEPFNLILPDDLKALKRLATTSHSGHGESGIWSTSNPWEQFDQVVVPLDSVKPLDRRRGWSSAEVAMHNRERFENLITAGWDLVIVDEAHRLGGSTDQIARYRLGRGLADAAPYLLMLSATPHQGKTDAFHRLVSLLDEEAFPDPESVSRERIQPYVIRTEKRKTINADGKPLFEPRHTQLVPIAWGDHQRRQQVLYDAVTEYVRAGYNRAVMEKKTYIGFLMTLMQRLVTSSTRAIRRSLERRREVLEQISESLSRRKEELDFLVAEPDMFYDLDGQEQADTLLDIQVSALEDEHREVQTLLKIARQTEESGVDAKAEALLEWILQLQQEERDSSLKTLIFTEFVPTQEMLRDFLQDRGYSVVCLNGSMEMAERQAAQDSFASEARIMVSTDAGGEGLNLQFCHVVINYDMPWNPMRVEQRIGRVDRIGQSHPVRALNFVLHDTVEFRIQEVLEQKLAVILEEFGVDKTGDVLDSAQAGEIFDNAYMEALLHPDELEDRIESLISQVRESAQTVYEKTTVLGTEDAPDAGAAKQMLDHPLPYWLERMVLHYIRAYGGEAKQEEGRWELAWPDGKIEKDVIFSIRDAQRWPSGHYLTLEDDRIRRLVHQLPRFVSGQPIPTVSLPDLPKGVSGIWSLWRVELLLGEEKRDRLVPIFIHDDGRVLGPTARYVWDRLLDADVEVVDYIQDDLAERHFDHCREAAEHQGKAVYDQLVQEHHANMAREREKGEFAFSARQRVIERIGLPEVREYRLASLDEEKRLWRQELDRRTEFQPDLVPLIFINLPRD